MKTLNNRAYALAIALLLMTTSVGAVDVSMTVDYVGDSYFDIIADLDPQMSTNHEFYLDISFPYGVQSVSILDENDWAADAYPAGSTINHRYNGEITSSYILVSGFIQGASGSENLELKIRVYPNMSGEIDIYYRGTEWFYTAQDIDPNDGYGCSYDQQGWPVYCETVMFGPDELPDLDITNIKVNNDNSYYAGQEVQLKAYVSEINGQDAGSARVNFYVDGEYVGYDNTANMDANESHTASIDYTFSTSGTYEVQAIVDPNDDIPEDNENNNGRSENTTALQNHSPTVSISGVSTNGLNATVDWTGNDQDGHTVYFSYQLDNGSWSGWTTSTSQTFTSLSESTHSFCVKCKDELDLPGNTDCENFTVSINHAPVVTITNITVNGESASMTWNGTDSDNDDISYQYKLDTGNWSSPTSSTSVSYNNLSVGNHTFYVKCSDEHNLAGNTDSEAFSIAEINHAPTVQITNVEVTNQNVVINLSTNDEDGDLVYIKHKLHNESWSDWHQNLTISYFDLPSTDYTFFVECKDEHNMLGNSTSQEFSIGNPDENDLTDWGEPGTFTWTAFATGTAANQQYGYYLAENVPVVSTHIINFLDTFDPATAEWSAYQVDSWPSSYKTNWFTILDDTEYLVKIRWKDLLYTDYGNSRGFWPEIEIEHRPVNQRVHLKGLQRFDVENIGNHIKIINNADLMNPLSSEYAGMGRAAMVSQEGYLSVYSSVHLTPNPPGWYTILEQPELINTEFNLKTINPRVGNGPANSWATMQGSVDDVRNFFRQDRSFRISTPAATSSAKVMQYLSNGGKIISRVAIGVAVIDVGYSLLQQDWQGAVCDATSFSTSWMVASPIMTGGAAACGPLWFAGGVPGALCTVGVFGAALVTSYFTYEVTQDVCNATWEYIAVESDMFGEEIHINRDELIEIDEELQSLGIESPMQIVVQSEVVENTGSYPDLLQVSTPENFTYSNNESNFQSTEQFVYTVTANEDSLDMVFSLKNAQNGDYQVVLNTPTNLNNSSLKVSRGMFGNWVIDSSQTGSDTVLIHLESFDVTNYLTASSTEELNQLITNANEFNISEIRITPGVYYPEWYILSNDLFKLVGESTTDCILDYQGSMGLTFLDMNTVEIANLTVRNTNQHAISVQSADRVTVRNSVFYNNQNKGIALTSVDSVTIANNTIDGVNGEAIWSNNSNIYVVNNSFSENSTAIAITNSGHALLEYNNLFNNALNDNGNNVEYSDGNIYNNPMFMDVSQNNYHVWPESPMIDAGHPSFSYENEPTPNGSRINMGAYGNTNEAHTSSTNSTGEVKYSPSKFVLNQNYPNPFNPSTTISYNLPKTCKVELTIFSLTGNTVMTLVNEVQQSGDHSINLDLGQNELSSGIYLYRLVTPEFQATRKITYLK